MINFSKIIPINVRIKTLYWVRKERLYWVRKEREINVDLERLFDKIDTDKYSEALTILNQLREKWTPFSFNYPKWFQIEYIGQFSKAEAMINFLTSPFEE